MRPDIKKIVKEELDIRFKFAKKEILKFAGVSFASTAVSQNSTIDTLSVLMINCKLIHRIILSTGFRPDIKQTLRIYVNVIFSAFFAHISQYGVDQTATILMKTFVGGVKNIPGVEIVAGSVIDGTINAVMTLRVGFLTISYLKKGAKGQIDAESNNEAVKNAIRELPNIIGNKSRIILDFINRFFKDNKSTDNKDINESESYEESKKLSLKFPFVKVST